MPIVNRTIKAKEKFVAQYHGDKFVIEALQDGAPDKFNFHMVEPVKFKGPSAGAKSLQGGADGRTFTSLSGAASAIAFPGRWDGWIFWTREKEWKPEMGFAKRGASARAVKKTVVAKAAPKAKAEKAAKPTRATVVEAQEVKKVAAKAQPKAERSTKTSKAPKAELVAAAPKSKNGSKPIAVAVAAPVKAATRTRAPKAEPAELDI